ncbi:hypothetical protein L1987_47949 [Smallanthus sonchifolius]|uniref:Uncharacterized protein n=1 Tax=Smallanthus sonchifolius TaxID=185202 RepID=A0ACB9FQN3_9ASTR|nr:hypothetical protein L1987_47949 [Smallanthus sonchifolius]
MVVVYGFCSSPASKNRWMSTAIVGDFRSFESKKTLIVGSGEKPDANQESKRSCKQRCSQFQGLIHKQSMVVSGQGHRRHRILGISRSGVPVVPIVPLRKSNGQMMATTSGRRLPVEMWAEAMMSCWRWSVFGRRDKA